MEKEEFRAKVMVHKNKMYRFALSYTKSTEEAQDVVQDVMMKLWETRHELREIKSLEAWCVSLTRNKALDTLKRASNRLNTSMDSVSNLGLIETNSESPHETLSKKERMEKLMHLINQLPEKQKAIFMLREVEGYSYMEISEALHTDMNQVKVNLFRARQTLKEKYLTTEAYGPQKA